MKWYFWVLIILLVLAISYFIFKVYIEVSKDKNIKTINCLNNCYKTGKSKDECYNDVCGYLTIDLK